MSCADFIAQKRRKLLWLTSCSPFGVPMEPCSESPGLHTLLNQYIQSFINFCNFSYVEAINASKPDSTGIYLLNRKKIATGAILQVSAHQFFEQS